MLPPFDMLHSLCLELPILVLHQNVLQMHNTYLKVPCPKLKTLVINKYVYYEQVKRKKEMRLELRKLILQRLIEVLKSTCCS